MSGHEVHVVAKRPQPAGDQLDKLLVIALGKIGAADGAGEEHVADEGDLGVLVEEHNMAWRMSRTVADAEFGVSDLHRVAVLEPAVGRAVLGIAEARPPGVAAHVFE